MNVHIINPHISNDINSSLRQLNAIQQIEKFKGNTKVIYYDDSIENGFINNKPIISKMLEVASKDIMLDDFIICSNSDCIPNKSLYGNLEYLDPNTIYVLHRADISSWEAPDTIPDIMYQTSNGIDGFIISRKKYEEIKKELPPLIHGEPHWDNIYLQIFNKYANVVHLRGTLFHVEHLRKWVSDTEFHNLKWIEDNKAEREEIFFNKDNDIKLSVITSFYNPSEERIKATLQFINKLPIQSLNFELIFIELYEGEPIFKHLNNYLDKFCIESKKINIEVKDCNKSLFQRECLYNKYYKEASSDNILFVDCDVMAFDFMWFDKIVKELDDKEVVQCFREVKDTLDPEYHYQSTFKKCIYGIDSDLPDNPGIGWAMKKSFLDEIGGFNIGMMFGGSDSCFFEEITSRKTLNNYNGSIRNLAAYKDVIRDIGRDVEVGYVDVDLLHFNHGRCKTRKYYERHLITDYVKDVLNKQITDFIEFGELLRWKKPINPVRFIYENRHKINKYKPIKHINEIYSEYIDLYKNDSQSITLFSYKNLNTDYWQYTWGSNIIRYHKGIPVDKEALYGFDALVCKKESHKGNMLVGVACNKHWISVKIDSGTLSFFIKKKLGTIKVRYQNSDGQKIDIAEIGNEEKEFLFEAHLENIDSFMCVVFDSECEFSVSNIVIDS